jgi:hypothetical protein
MPRTIYSTAGAFPVALEGTKRVKTFPSGLVLVTQDYAVPRGQEADYAATFDVGQPLEVDSPAIDGLYIFPEPEWTDSGDGFTRLTVSAYGRFNSTGNKTLTKSISEHIARWMVGGENTPTVNTRSIPTISDQLVWQFVLPKSTAPNVVPTDTLKIYRLNGQQVNPLLLSEFFNVYGHRTEAGTQTLTKSVISKIRRAENINFGAFDEWTVVYDAQYENTTFDFGLFLIISSPTKNNVTSTQLFGSFSSTENFYQNIETNNSANVQVLKVWNINAPTGSWNSTTPRQEMALNGTTPTYRGGTFISNAPTSATYTPPAVAPPGSGFPAPTRSITKLSHLPPPESYTSGVFTWNAVLTGTTSDSEGIYKIYTYQLKNSPVHEIFEIQIGNELGQTSTFIVRITFEDPE